MSEKTDRRRPQYLVPDDVDALARQNTALMAELWIVKDRLFALENLLQKSGVLDREQLENWKAEGDDADKLQAEREAYIARIISTPAEDRNVETLKERAKS